MGLDGAQRLDVDEGAATVAGGAGAEESVEDGHGWPFAGLGEFTQRLSGLARGGHRVGRGALWGRG